MPFLYDTHSCSPFSSLSPPSPTSTLQQKRMPFNFLRRKSTKVKRTNNVESTASAFGSLSVSGNQRDSKSTTTPTRRPANPPTVANPFSNPSMPLPSIYSDIPTATASSQADAPPPNYTSPAPAIAPSTDSPYAFLGSFDTIFLIDDSGSMAGERWRQTAAALAAITPICTRQDKDGIDIYFLNTRDKARYCNVTSEDAVNAIFREVSPGGWTPTGKRLNDILKPYLQQLETKGKGHCEMVKPLNIIVLTDGAAGDDPESVILDCAKKLDRLEAPGWQVGIQFFQVGTDAEATEALKGLDDGLMAMGCERDIVDTVTWTRQDGTVGLNADGILKVVLGAVNRRLDRQKLSLDSIRRH